MAEASYNGVKFGSMLMARWAVFFDILGIEYLHEPERFKSENRVIVPSFFLPTLGDDHFAARDTLIPPGIFMHVQFSEPTGQEAQDASAISNHTDRAVYIFHGASMTAGLAVWPKMGVVPGRCFFSQCPFCGRYGVSISSKDEQPLANVHSHACMEEYKIPERYNVLSHCSQDLLISPHSPALAIAYEGARAAQITDRVSAWQQAVQAVMNTKTYCSPDITEWVITNAHHWASEKASFMHFDGAPWWVQHKKDLEAGVSPCTCYSCVGRGRETSQPEEDIPLPVKTPIQ